MALSTIPFSGLSSDASNQGVNFRNLIINGDMSIAQRGTSSSGLTGSSYNTLDRYKIAMNSAGTWTMSQDTDVPTGQGFAKSLKLDCTTANASLSASSYMRIDQRLEGQNLQLLKKGTSNAESVTLSFWVKSNKTGTYICEVYDQDNTRQISKSYTISSASTWEKKTLTFDGDTTGTLDNDNARSLDVYFWLAVGTDYSSGTLNTSWNSVTTANRVVGQVNLADSTSNEWYITGVQLEVGTSASDFEFLPYDVNLQRCLRYYEICEGGWTGPVYGTDSDMRESVQFSVKKRANPTLTKISGSENCCSSVTVAVANQDETLGARVQGTNVFADGAGKFWNVKFSADSEL
jgi:hypothetical protein